MFGLYYMYDTYSCVSNDVYIFLSFKYAKQGRFNHILKVKLATTFRTEPEHGIYSVIM